ncbi:MAG: ABC transporter permease [Eubacterium sp.]|nr:ABC transporter permease [Eubacterium sp.]
MHIYKTFFKVAAQHKAAIIMYSCIIIFMLIAMTGGEKKSESTVTLAKYSLLVVDNDHSEISEALVSFLDKKHTLKENTYTDEQITSQIYYQRIAEYIVIPEGFGESFEKAIKDGAADAKDKDLTSLLQATYDDSMPRGIFVNMQINDYLNSLADYMNMGKSVSEASAKSEEALDISGFVSRQAQEINDCDKIYTSFTFLPYGILSIIFSSVLSVILSFNDKERKNRTMVSSIKMTSRNISLVMGTLTVAFVVTTLLIIINSLIQGSEFIFTKAWWLSAANAYIYTISITMLLSMITSLPLGIDKSGRGNTSAFVTNIIGLSFAFLGGTFVDLTVLGDNVAKVGRFIPNYWYSTASHSIWYEGAGINELLAPFGFQLLFGIVCLSIGLAFTKFFGNDRLLSWAE